LVSVYIPAGYDIIKIINHLQQEQGTASNIKDARTRRNVIDSLEKAIHHLRLFKKTPPNGLAVFAGNASEVESKIDIKVWSIEPSEKLNIRMYRCDQTFVLDILKDMLEPKETYGLIVLDRNEGNIGLLKGTSVTELTKLTSGVPGKQRKGGQSAPRFSRVREEMTKEFFKRIAEKANQAFLEMKNIKGILIGGPGPTKEDFFRGDYLNNQLKKKVIGLVDLGYTGDFGLNELVDKSEELLAKEEIIKEKNVLNEFFSLLGKDPKKVAYKEDRLKRALERGAVEKLLLSEVLDDKEIEDLTEKAENIGAEVFIISVESREGKQLKILGGLAAILRYAI
jgi:peptide chain release factor subunit 1